MGRLKKYENPLSPKHNRRCCCDFDVNEGLKLYQDPVLRLSYALKKVSVHQKGVYKNYIPIKQF
jgi:hypothetical protein